jgi:hypothetical protein
MIRRIALSFALMLCASNDGHAQSTRASEATLLATRCVTSAEAREIIVTYLREASQLEPLNCTHWDYLFNYQIYDFAKELLFNPAYVNQDGEGCSDPAAILAPIQERRALIAKELGDQTERCTSQLSVAFCQVRTDFTPINLRRFPHTGKLPREGERLSRSDGIQRLQIVLKKAEYKKWAYVTGTGTGDGSKRHGWLFSRYLDCRNSFRPGQ